MVFSNLPPSVLSSTMLPATGAQTPAAGTEKESTDADMAAKATKARLKGVQDGGPVNPVKTYANQSDATGSNDYFTALGYDS